MPRSILHLTAMENFKGQPFTGIKSFDLQAYRVMAMFPYEIHGLDAERRKTQQALYVLVKNLTTQEQKVFYCKEIKIDNV